jgi:hypothetical protein
MSSAALVRAETPLASDALPGVHRAAFATPLAPAFFSGALTLGYGFTEAQGSGDSAHHRQLARLAAGLSPSKWFAASVRFDQRYDQHDGDSGWVFDPRLGARLSLPLADHFYLGPDLSAWLPGSESVSSSFEAVTLDARLLATYASQALTAGLALGYRLDNSAKAGTDAPLLGDGDRLALGLSDFDAALAALGLAYDLGGTVLKGEISADLLIGDGAPPLLESPLRAAAGIAQELGAALALDFTVEGVLSSRPGHGPTDALVPIEPRVTALVGLRFALEPASAAAPPPPPPKPVAVVPPPPPQPTTVPVEIALTDDEGQPVVDATVTLEIDGQTHPLQGDGNGNYKLEKAPIGKGQGKLRATGDGMQPVERDVKLDGGAPVKLAAQAPVALPSAQVRGLVRSFQGKPLKAKILVQPSGKEVTTDDSGAFVIDVEPGEYEVVIEAPGFETQRRNVKVAKQGVVVLNADLVKKR